MQAAKTALMNIVNIVNRKVFATIHCTITNDTVSGGKYSSVDYMYVLSMFIVWFVRFVF